MRTARLRVAALWLLAGLCAMLLAGCALWPRPLAPIHYYSIDPPPLAPAPGAGGAARGVLAVRALGAASRYRERIVSRRGAADVEYHEYHRWVEPPAEMITAVLRRALEGAGLAAAVVDDRLVRRSDFVLDGRLLRCDEVRGGTAWAAVCEVELVLKQAEDSGLLLATRLGARREAKAHTTEAFVEAMNAAAADVAAQAAEAVGRALAAHKAPR